ncbi:MAG: GNAT family protein [Pseudomonadota bacterium]
MEIRTARAPGDIAKAVAIDKAHIGTNERSDYITSVAERGGLSIVVTEGGVQAFSCLDHGYFFGKPFISLLIVAPVASRQGFGTELLLHSSDTFPEVWTSTNRSNEPMRRLLSKAGWRYCGEVSGLDEGDPEHFFRSV